MATIVLIFLVALGLAAALGWTTDTRDSADWRTDDWLTDRPEQWARWDRQVSKS